jgi:hypothetical protein
VLRDRHLHLYRVLWANAYHRPGRRPICDLSQAKLALALDLTTRQVQRLLADLRQPGPDLRHPSARPAGERVAYLTVYPAERRPGGRPGGRGAGGGRLLVGNRYILNVTLPEVEAAVRGQLYAPAVAGGLIEALEGRLTFPQVEAHMPRSYRSDIAEEPVSAGHTEATREAMSLDPIGVERERGYQQLPGWPQQPGGAPAAQPPPRPGEPGYQQWAEAEKRRQLAELDAWTREHEDGPS